MELKCIEQYNDIRFTLRVGDTTAAIPYLTEEEKKGMLKDYPEKFEVIGNTEKPASESELKIETKIPKVETRTVKLTKK